MVKAELAVSLTSTLDEEDADAVPVETVLADCWAVTPRSCLVPSVLCLAAKTSDLQNGDPTIVKLLTFSTNKTSLGYLKNLNK